MASRFLFAPAVVVIVLAWLMVPSVALPGVRSSPGTPLYPSADNPAPPGTPIKLIFIHHSTGEGWLADEGGGLGIALRDNHYFVSDTNYGWGPDAIGDTTDIGHWWTWFAGPNRDVYTAALYAESGQHSAYSRLSTDPGGENQIIMFKSCFPNSNLGGNPNDPPTTGANPLRGQDAGSEHHTVANAKGIYNDILAYFATRQDKLFIVITAPPLVAEGTDPTYAANARAFNNWLVNDWLDGYPYHNVAVFDFYNVLTSNGGNSNTNDLGWATGNHHRWWNGAVQHIQTVSSNYAAYGNDGDSHPTAAGGQKATGEFVPLLNVFYNRWRAAGTATPTPTTTATTATPGTPTPTTTATLTATPTPTTMRRWLYLPLILKLTSASVTPTPTLTGASTSTPTAMPTVTRTSTASPTPTVGLCAGPEPSLVTDLQVRQPPALVEPAPRVPFRDPAFGRCVVRVTDRTNDKAEPGGLKNEYSRVQSFNADGTRLLAMSTQGGWYLYNAHTLQPLGSLPLVIEPRWSATDPNLIYFSEETRLMAYHLATQQAALVHEFANDFPGQNLAAVWTRYEGSPSRDGRWWGLMAEDQNWLTAALLVYDLATNQVTAKLDTRGWSAEAREMDSVTISPLGNYFLVYMDLYCEPGHLGTPANPCGLMVYDRNLQNGRGLLRIIGHSDTALDAQGREVLVYQDIDTDHISMLDLATGAVTPLWPIDFTYTGIGLHISGRGLDRPGWAVISTHDEDAASHTWMDDSVFLIELKASGRVVRLANTHSLVDPNQEHDYWAEPQASANRDLSRVLFTSNWGRSGSDGVEMYLIELPTEWRNPTGVALLIR
ncbi:MAG: hypothetical protein WHX53_00220 [Anaerolineae bacterium]